MQRPRQVEAPGDSGLRQRAESRATRITEPQQLGTLVEGFAGGVVNRFTQQFVVTDGGYPHELRVTARDQQGDKRKRRGPLGKQGGQKMPLKVVHRECRHAESQRHAAGRAGADQECAGQSGPLRIGDRVEVRCRDTGFVQYPPGQRQDPADVVTRGQFGNHAAVILVHANLGVERMRQQAFQRPGAATLGVVQGDSGFVT